MNWFHYTGFMKLSRYALLVLFSGVLMLGCGDNRGDQYQLQGDTYYRLNKLNDAEEAYQNAIRSNPENVLAKLGLGRCQIALQKPNEALVLFQETTLIDPQFALGHLETARLLLELGRPEEAFNAAQVLEGVNPELGGVLYASLLLNSGRQTEAQSTLLSLRERFPESDLIRTHVASILLWEGKPQAAESELRVALHKQETNSVGAKILLVEAHIQQGKIAAIISELEAVKDNSLEQEMILAYALLRTDRKDEGEAMVQIALKNNSAAPWVNFVLGSYLITMEQSESATPYVRMASHALPWEAVIMHKSMPARYALASPTSTDSDMPPVKDVESPSILSETNDWRLLWRQASLRRLLTGREEFEVQNGDSSFKETLVLAAVFLGDTALAQELAKDLAPGSPLNGYLSALLDGDGEKAVKALKPWSKEDDSFQILAMNAVGFAVGISGNRNSSIQILSNCTTQFPENGVSLFLVAKVYRSANMHRFAAQAIGGMTARFPENLGSHLMVIQALQDAGMHDEARQSAQVMYALFPHYREAVLITSRIYLQDKQLEESRNILENYLKAHPDDLELKLALASVLFRGGHIDDVLAILDEVVLTEEMAPGFETLEALSYSLKSNWQQVIVGAKSNDARSISLAARFILLAAYVNDGQKDAAAALLVQEGKEKPFGGRVGDIILYALNSSSTELSDSDVLLAKALSENIGVLRDFASGTAYQMAKFYDAAYMAFSRVDSALSFDNDLLLSMQFRNLSKSTRIVDVEKEALTLVEEHAQSPKAWLECATIARQQNNVTFEGSALAQALKYSTDDAGVFLLRGDFFSRQKDYDLALAEYRRALEIEPENPLTNNNLAYHILLTGGDINEALAAAQLAAKGLPNSPQVYHTLGVAQLRSGDLDKSAVNLRTALSSMPGDPTLLLDYGQLLNALGDTEGGRRHIESSLATTRVLGLDFDRQQEAEDLLVQ